MLLNVKGDKMQRMNWTDLLCAERYGSRGGSATRDERRNEFERDGGRILYSSAFRRLQDKTQVFPLGRNDYVRTRLTHSLEVQNVGRSLGLAVGEKLLKREKELEKAGMTPSGVAAIVSAACLAHDIGNPPFGHSGEEAISRALARYGLPQERMPFEGNAQGFRLLTRTADPMEGKGLKLTAAVLAAFMKYPCSEAYRRGVKAEAYSCVNKLECKKFGFIEADEEAARWVGEKTGLLRRSAPAAGEPLCFCRHPLAYLMEAADDMSYLIADVEDAFICGIIDYEAARAQLCSLLEAGTSPDYAVKLENGGRLTEAIHFLRACAIGSCITAVRETFWKEESALLEGRLERSLMQVSPLGAAYKALSDFSVKHIYGAPQVEAVEVMGFQVIDALVALLMEWVASPSSPLGRKLGRLLGAEKLPEPLPGGEEGRPARLQHMLDYLSGMTDSFALETYRHLYGLLT